jgi:hypothetical protein
MTQVENRILTVIAAIATGFLVSGCAASSSITKTYEDSAFSGVSYQSILVAAATQVYENRATYERAMSARLVSAGVKATPLYQIGGGNRPVDRDVILEAVRTGEFDAVLYTQTTGSQTQVTKTAGQTTVDPNRKSDSVVNLFRYDYEENADPDYAGLTTSATVTTALYSVSTQTKVWEARSDLAERDSVDLLIDDAVSLLMGALKRDKLLDTGASGKSK